MGYVVSGGEDKFRERPLFSQSTDPVSPLVHSKGATDTLIQAIRLGVPAKINSMGLAGGTTCVHLASTLVTHNAEMLSMFVLSQLVKKGHPMVYGTSTALMDLRTTIASVGCPELALFSAAVAKMAQFYNIPSWVAGG
jgi:trimethylamine--corrinoid protein Co-methyltransferase